MNRMLVLAALLVGLLGVSAVLFMLRDATQPVTLPSSESEATVASENRQGETGATSDGAENEASPATVADVLASLPHRIEVSGRTITFDAGSLDSTPRDEYAALPYRVDIGGKMRLVETDLAPRPAEGPIGFVERFLASRLPGADTLATAGEDAYETTVSIHPMPEAAVAAYPGADEATPAEEGVSVYVRRMNFPDDSVGGREDRFDFVRSDGVWIFVWHGERTYCRRPENEFWQPADQLCP